MGRNVEALIHYIQIQSVYVIIIHLVILAHVLLMFWKPPSPTRLSEVRLACDVITVKCCIFDFFLSMILCFDIFCFLNVIAHFFFNAKD